MPPWELIVYYPFLCIHHPSQWFRYDGLLPCTNITFPEWLQQFNTRTEDVFWHQLLWALLPVGDTYPGLMSHSCFKWQLPRQDVANHCYDCAAMRTKTLWSLHDLCPSNLHSKSKVLYQMTETSWVRLSIIRRVGHHICTRLLDMESPFWVIPLISPVHRWQHVLSSRQTGHLPWFCIIGYVTEQEVLTLGLGWICCTWYILLRNRPQIGQSRLRINKTYGSSLNELISCLKRCGALTAILGLNVNNFVSISMIRCWVENELPSLWAADNCKFSTLSGFTVNWMVMSSQLLFLGLGRIFVSGRIRRKESLKRKE